MFINIEIDRYIIVLPKTVATGLLSFETVELPASEDKLYNFTEQ